MLTRLIAPTPLILLLAVGPALARELAFELAVKQDGLIGGSRGTLVISSEGIEYRTPEKDRARHWGYLDLKEVRLLSPATIELATYEDRGLLHAGNDRAFQFELTEGGIGTELVAFLLERVERPVVTSVMPPLSPEPRFRMAVKHQRWGRGTDGSLLLYDDGLAFLAERDGDARYWRFRDLYAVLHLDRDRLQILAYEGGGGDTRPYTFELKERLPVGAYEALWQDINRPPQAGSLAQPD